MRRADNDAPISVEVTSTSPTGLSDVLVQIVRDMCKRLDKDPAEGTAMLLLAAMKIYVMHAKERALMPEHLAAIVEEMGAVYLKELEAQEGPEKMQ